ncbi:hypothetical protein D3C85_1276970 [compost metagenome]
MLYAIIVMSKRTAGVVRRIDKYALNLARILRFQRFECQQVIALDQQVVLNVWALFACQ